MNDWSSVLKDLCAGTKPFLEQKQMYLLYIGDMVLLLVSIKAKRLINICLEDILQSLLDEQNCPV